MRCPLATPVLAAATSLLLAACSSGPSGFDAGRLDAERTAKLRACETAYRAEAPEYPALRDALLTDPVAANWLTRMFVLDVLRAREGQPLDEDETDLLRAAAGIADPLERRAIVELEALGRLALPVVLGDLLRHSQPQPRELGIELVGRLAATGAVTAPDLEPLASSSNPRERRVAARSLGAIGGDGAVQTRLIALAGDAEFAVRADAMRGLGRTGEGGAVVLRAALQQDADPFVRRAAVQALARHRSPATAQAVVDYLQRCHRDRDTAGELTAQKTLEALAGTRGKRSVADWRSWALQQGK